MAATGGSDCSLRGLARRLGTAPSAVYRHFPSRDDLLRYRLVFGDPLGGYVGTEATTTASLRSSAVLLEVVADLVAADQVDVEGLTGRLDPRAEQSYGRWAAALPHPFPPVALSAAITCYAAQHGAPSTSRPIGTCLELCSATRPSTWP